MKFGVFDYIEGSEEPLQKTYEERLVLIQALEFWGFHGYHLSEHHATPLSMTPSPSIFLAAAARETKSIPFGQKIETAERIEGVAGLPKRLRWERAQ